MESCFQIWAGMSVQRSSPKSVRLTAMDSSGQIKVFLVMVSMLHSSSNIPRHLRLKDNIVS
jgi:hypothetical protein